MKELEKRFLDERNAKTSEVIARPVVASSPHPVNTIQPFESLYPATQTPDIPTPDIPTLDAATSDAATVEPAVELSNKMPSLKQKKVSKDLCTNKGVGCTNYQDVPSGKGCRRECASYQANGPPNCQVYEDGPFWPLAFLIHLINLAL